MSEQTEEERRMGILNMVTRWLLSGFSKAALVDGHLKFYHAGDFPRGVRALTLEEVMQHQEDLFA